MTAKTVAGHAHQRRDGAFVGCGPALFPNLDGATSVIWRANGGRGLHIVSQTGQPVVDGNGHGRAPIPRRTRVLIVDGNPGCWTIRLVKH